MMIIFLSAIFSILVGLSVYVAIAYQAYKRVLPAERACMNCKSPVTVNGYDLFYRELGADKGQPPVILVHGGPGHSSLSFKNGFDFLAADRRVIYYDQRGSGNSQVKPNPADCTITQLVEELETLRREIVRAEKIILVGHSFGSALVQHYALKYPQHVEKMVIIGGIRINNGMSNRFIWKWFGPALYSLAMKFPPADSRAADEWFTRLSSGDSSRLFDKTRLDLLENTGRLSFAPWREISLSLVGPNHKTELSQLDIPTLFIYGTADSPFTGQPVAAELCATLPNCRSVAFEHSGHWPFLEQPEQFQQVVKEFIR
jgi:proline iminopeptidase